ncbi:hypothetical protein [Methanolobus chelungpuianus]|uniref:hypothetical protein n=1 Tax=Methanolobus chelungpuianus TaxID=502115 RepID=UPI002115B635|nr:hypothetical protein [Methanolobus chelungpuianus]
MTKYIIKEKLPTVEEYISLRKSVGWPCPGNQAIEKSLGNSTCCVCAVDKDRVVGMSRLVGASISLPMSSYCPSIRVRASALC